MTFICDHCDQSFATVAAIITHIQQQHTSRYHQLVAGLAALNNQATILPASERRVSAPHRRQMPSVSADTRRWAAG